MRDGLMKDGRRALVLSSAGSWSAYQAGAVRALRNLRFDVVAGTGLGAINAALVACGEFDALERFWRDISPWRLARPNLRRPWRDALARPGPLRRLLRAHLSEARLVARGVTLELTAMDLRSGDEVVLCYPGAGLPLVDAVLAASATPGLLPAVRDGDRLLVEGTFRHSIPSTSAASIVAVLPGLPRRPPPAPAVRRLGAALSRTLEINLLHDVRTHLAEGAADAAAAVHFDRVRQRIPQRLVATTADPDVAARLHARLTSVYRDSSWPGRREAGPAIVSIVPSHELGYPMWRFGRRDLQAAVRLGERDARRAVGEHEFLTTADARRPQESAL